MLSWPLLEHFFCVRLRAIGLLAEGHSCRDLHQRLGTAINDAFKVHYTVAKTTADEA